MSEPDRVRDHPRSHDREVWGDDPEEIAEEFPGTERRWHDHPAFAPPKAVGLFIKRSGKRIAVTVAGFAVLIAGIAMLVLPGPGVVVILAGLAILATEYAWAERMLAEAKRRAIQAKDVVLRKDKGDTNGDSTAA